MRYSNCGYEEILSEDNKISGINFGYGYYAEHEHGYNGVEKEAPFDMKISNKNFKDEIIKLPNMVFFFVTTNGNAVLSNDYFYIQKSPLERDKIVESFVNQNSDKIQCTKIINEYNPSYVMSPYDVFWNASNFLIISKDAIHNEKLKYLYNEIKNGNVAISNDFSSIFKDRGLSFVCLDKLTKKDNLKKLQKDNYKNQLYLFQEEMNQYLKSEGFELDSKKYPVQPSNVQIQDITTSIAGKMIPQFYTEFCDERENNELDDQLLNDIPSQLTDKEIQFLVKTIKSEEFNLLLEGLTTQELNQYLSKKLSNYRDKIDGGPGKQYHR